MYKNAMGNFPLFVNGGIGFWVPALSFFLAFNCFKNIGY